MTRLTSRDIEHIPEEWEQYERELVSVTGQNLLELAAAVCSCTPEEAGQICAGKTVGVVPISSGEGIIKGFDTALASIAEYLGFSATILPEDDAGFDASNSYDVRIWADDNDFVVENMHTGAVAENGLFTGQAFAATLHAMCVYRGVQSSTPVLVRGCGPVGSAAACYLAKRNYPIVVCDPVQEKALKVVRTIRTFGEEASFVLPQHVKASNYRYQLVLDAAPVPPIFPTVEICSDALVSAPGVPCKWSETYTLWHDPLQLGTAAMFLAACADVDS